MEEFVQFELQVEHLLQSWQALNAENQRLRHKLTRLMQEHQILKEKHKTTTVKIKRIIGELRTEMI